MHNIKVNIIGFHWLFIVLIYLTTKKSILLEYKSKNKYIYNIINIKINIIIIENKKLK